MASPAHLSRTAVEPETAAPIEPGPAAAAPVQAGLAAAVVELERAAACAEALQLGLSPLLRRGGEGAEACQALDDLTQHLRGLGQFLAVIARDCPAHWRFDLDRAGASLGLHAQKLRLIRQGPADPSLPPPPSGELELW